MERKEYEEFRPLSPRWSWAIMVLFCAAIIGWGLFNYRFIPDRPREWNFGSLKDTPAESIYSTAAASQPANPPLQIVPLPSRDLRHVPASSPLKKAAQSVAGILPAEIAAGSEGKMPSQRAGGTPATLFQRAASGPASSPSRGAP